MIARHWRGWTRPEDADVYERFLKDVVIAGLHLIEGFRRTEILRRVDGAEVEFVVINFFDSLDAIRAFAGDDYRKAKFEPEALRLLSRYEPHAVHYEVTSPTPRPL